MEVEAGILSIAMDSRSISDLYDAFYYKYYCGRPYERNEPWLGFFASIADRIVKDISPGTVLDAGCAMGFLVEALRDRGIEARGVDVSEYAIQHVRTDVRPYCWIGTLADHFPQRYDLIVCIEVLEHLPLEDLEEVIENFCQHTDDVLFSSTPFDYKEATHLNVRPPDYWAERFARRGFFRDVDFDGTFLTPWTARFRKSRDGFSRVVAGYERRLWQLEKENQGRRELTIEQRSELAQKDGEIQTLTQQTAANEEALAELKRQLEDGEALRSERAERQRVINALSQQAAENDQSIRALRSEASEMQSVIDALSQQAARKDQSIQGLRSELEERQREIEVLSQLAAKKDRSIEALSARVRDGEAQLAKITNTIGWRLLRLYGRIKYPYLLPIYRLLRLLPAESEIATRKQTFGAELIPESTASPYSPETGPPAREIAVVPPLENHHSTVDIIICVHNALDDVRRCLESVIRYSRPPYSLILVDDGSDEEAHSYLSEFARAQGATFIRNDSAKGYTFAANQGLRQSRSDYAILLNSDTVVTPNWLDRMVACGESDPEIGLVGPLSNKASWQSIPEVLNREDWAENEMPVGMTPSDMGRLLVQYSGRLYPRIHFLNGFCLMIKRQVLDRVGLFDEATFGKGYGEENDYCLRARDAGWQLAVADDTYIYHHQSRSYSHERRKQLSKESDSALVAKHGQPAISDGVDVCRFDRVLEGVRARAKVMTTRQQMIQDGLSRWEGKRVIFVLPITEPGGGGNVILQEAKAMQQMGVDVRILNLSAFRGHFQQSYPESVIPVIYSDKEHHIPELIADYDAVIATVYTSVHWLEAISQGRKSPVRGYYVQDFEPDFFSQESDAYRSAWNSYARYSDLVRFTKTEWNREMVKGKVGVDCVVVGPSVETDLYRPRRRRDPNWPERPLRIAGMIRPSTPRRNPKLTMEVLREIQRSHGNTIEVILFGCRSDDGALSVLPNDFAWRSAGILTKPQLAFLLNEIDIFVDFSSFQAMGLTAMEAMACGAGVIVPQRGGAESFARHEQNSIIVDTDSYDACLGALERLIMDEKLREQVQRQAIVDICEHFPDRAAYNVLNALFGQDTRG